MRNIERGSITLRLMAHLRTPPTLVSVIAAVSLLIAASMVADSIVTVVRLRSALPYFDEWYSLDLLRNLISGEVAKTDIFTYHNEHLIFFPRIFLFVDYLIFGGKGDFDYILIFAMQLAHLFMLLWLLRRSGCWIAGAYALAGVVTMLMSSLRQSENFLWGFQVQFVGVFALATLACILYADALSGMLNRTPRRGRMVAAYAVALIATYSMANGLLIGLVFVGLAIMARAPFRIVAAALLMSGLFVVAYLNGVGPRGAQGRIGVSPRDLWAMAQFMATYIGNFLDPHILRAEMLGTFGLAAAVAAVGRSVILRDRDPVRLALVGIMSFTAATALLTAVGRANSGVAQAFSSRYSTGSGVFWSALMIYWWSLAEMGTIGSATAASLASGPRGVALLLRLAVTATPLILVDGAVEAQESMKPGLEDQAYSKRQAENALLLGLTDADSFDAVNDVHSLIASGSDFLKARRLSIFGTADAQSIGQSLTQVGMVADASFCSGSVDAASTDDKLGRDGLRLSGHVEMPLLMGTMARIYLVDPADRIVGLATQEPPSKDPSLWQGFASAPQGTVLRAFARLSRRWVCELGELPAS